MGLVNELYLETLKVKALRASNSGGESERLAFLGLAAHSMTRPLRHHSRPLSNRLEKSELEGSAGCARVGCRSPLASRASVRPNRGRESQPRNIVALRVFGGLMGNDCAAQMRVGSAAVIKLLAIPRYSIHTVRRLVPPTGWIAQRSRLHHPDRVAIKLQYRFLFEIEQHSGDGRRSVVLEETMRALLECFHFDWSWNIFTAKSSKPAKRGEAFNVSHNDFLSWRKQNVEVIHDWLQPDSVHHAPQPASELLAQ